MTTLFILLLVLALFHLFYESVLLPTIRMSVRYKLFALRDKLRMQKIVHGNELDDSVFRIVEDNINNAINLLPQFTVSYLVSASQIFDQNEKLKKSTDNRVRKVENCEIEEVKTIASDVTRHITTTFIWNTGGWLIYFVPVFILMLSYNLIKEVSKELVFVKNERSLGIPTYSSELAAI